MSAAFARASMLGPPLAIEALFGAASDEPAVYWASGDRTVLGLGAVWQARASGKERFSLLREAARELPAWARVFAGFAFVPTGSQAMPDAWAVLPRVLIERDSARTRVTLVRKDGRVTKAALVETLVWLEREQSVSTAYAPERVLDAIASDRAFCGLVDEACAEIAAHSFDKVVVHEQTHLAVDHAPAAGPVLARLAQTQAKATRYAFRVDGRVFLGATPERLVRVRGDRVSTDALAGSLPRSTGATARLLRDSAKDREEHRITSDAIVAVLRAHCADVRCSGPRVRTLPHLFHLHTAIRGRLRRPTHVLELVDALHPTPAVSGAPLAAALDFLATHEREPRLWYAAPIGWFRPGGDGDFAVALRCALLDHHRVTLYAGAGIVAGSRAERELAEVHSKRRTMAEALGLEAALS
jgi:isochorismate synthase